MRAFIVPLALLCLGYVHTRSLKDVDLNELDDTLVKINVQVGKIEKEIKAELKKKKGGNGGEEKGTGGEEEGKKANSIGKKGGEGEEKEEKGTFDITDHIMEVNMRDHKKEDLFEGDIMVAPGQIAKYKGVQGDLIKETSYHWPISGQVVNIPFAYGRSASSAAKSAFLQAKADYESKTCLRFIPRTNQAKYLQIVSETGCWSYVGKMRFNAQKVSLGSGCETKGIAIHELMHAIGYYHEQSRPDRDNFVKINYGNIRQGRASNFDKKDTINQGTQYDYNSIMHYGAYAFSKNGQPTIELKKGSGTIGQRDGFSTIDLLSINAKYCGKSTCFDKFGGLCNIYKHFCNNRWLRWLRNTARANCKASCKLC